VSYRKTSLGDSGGDSGSEQGSVVIRRPSPTLGPLSPPHIFHPEDNPLPSLQQVWNRMGSNLQSYFFYKQVFSSVFIEASET
jgi:hypothetical protein